MGRIKTIETITKKGTAIQAVRAAIGEMYEFNGNRDLTVSFKNDKFSGTFVNDTGAVTSFTGKDWLVKNESNHISVYSPESFAETFNIIDDTEADI
jgi:hypothetical protein